MGKTLRATIAGVTLASVALLVPATARADDDRVGQEVLGCFHPTAIYDSTSIGAPSRGDDGVKSVAGKIDFRGRFTDNRYYMRFVIYVRNVGGQQEFRVAPATDTSPFPPSAACRLLRWTPVL